MNKNQQSQALLTLYIKLFEKAYSFKPDINRYRAKWGMIDVIDSVGYEKANELLKYYFECEADHSPEHFFNNFDRLDAMKREIEADAKRRERLLRETRERMARLEY